MLIKRCAERRKSERMEYMCTESLMEGALTIGSSADVEVVASRRMINILLLEKSHMHSFDRERPLLPLQQIKVFGYMAIIS